MEALAKPLRKQLEDAVVTARDQAENAARAALMHLGVGDSEAPKHLTDDERALRRRLRAHGRQVGDHRRPDGHQTIDHLMQETAYEHWHRMLFARFLAEQQQQELFVVAAGLARTAQLLTDQYHWVIINVPYLTRGKHAPRLKAFCETHHSDAKNDLANVFLERCLELAQ